MEARMVDIWYRKILGKFLLAQVLASMIHYGEKLKVGMERVGISNFITFLENTAEYRYVTLLGYVIYLISVVISEDKSMEMRETPK
jgi:hypothetical protein